MAPSRSAASPDCWLSQEPSVASGLLAQNPDALADPKSFVHRLQSLSGNGSRVRYGVVCADFEPRASGCARRAATGQTV